MRKTKKKIVSEKIANALNEKRILKQIRMFDTLGEKAYLRYANAKLSKQTNSSTKNASSYWLIHDEKKYPLKTIGRMAALDGNFFDSSYPDYWVRPFENWGFKVVHGISPVGTYLRLTSNLGDTETDQLTKRRIGQEIFRKSLLKYWNGKCAVTGITNRQLLRASHIVAWADCRSIEDKLDPYNGLLLSALWDCAFDIGLVSFSNSGLPLFSSKLRVKSKDILLAGQSDRIKIDTKHIKFLKRHRLKYNYV